MQHQKDAIDTGDEAMDDAPVERTMMHDCVECMLNERMFYADGMASQAKCHREENRTDQNEMRRLCTQMHLTDRTCPWPLSPSGQFGRVCARTCDSDSGFSGLGFQLAKECVLTA